MSYETEVVDTRHGRFRIIKNDKWVSRSLRELGEHSEDELLTMRQILGVIAASKGHEVEMVEAGPYIGDLTVPLSRLVKRLYAFEPQPEIREILAENLEMNGCTNVEILPYALGHEKSLCGFKNDQDPDSPGSRQMIPDGFDVQVQMQTLDSFGLSPDFIKADVEGCEVPLLYGALDTIDHNRPVVFMERDTVLTQGTSLEDALTLLRYDQYKYAFPFFRQDNWNKTKVNTFGMTAAFMTLGVPQI